MFMLNEVCSWVWLIQIVEQHLGVLAAAQLDHHAHAFLVGLVAQAVGGDASTRLSFTRSTICCSKRALFTWLRAAR